MVPASEESDADFNVGTFKKITDDSWVFFHSDLQGLLKCLFSSINTFRENKMKQKRQKYAEKYKRLASELSDTMTIEELIDMLESAEDSLTIELNSKNIIFKKAGNAYNAHKAYIESIKSLIESKKEAQAEEDFSESQETLELEKVPSREPTPEPVNEPTPEPVNEPTSEPVREPTSDASQGQETTNITDSEQVTDYDSESESEIEEPEPERENMISIDAAFALLRSEFESVITQPLKQSVFENLLKEHRAVLEKFRV